MQPSERPPRLYLPASARAIRARATIRDSRTTPWYPVIVVNDDTEFSFSGFSQASGPSGVLIMQLIHILGAPLAPGTLGR